MEEKETSNSSLSFRKEVADCPKVKEVPKWIREIQSGQKLYVKGYFRLGHDVWMTIGNPI